MSSPPCSVLCSSSWLCHADVSSVLHVSGPESAASTGHITAREDCVTLELPTATEDGLPCTLTLVCAPQRAARILDVTVCSEARTIEIYSCSQDSQEEEYLHTRRGERHCTFSDDGEAPITLYKAHFKLNVPVPACKIKLLSLGGRQSVLVGAISIELTSIPEASSRTPPSLLGPSINLERVQSIMDSMGGKMSPGAEQLMNMVRAQQKNQMPFGPHLLQMFGSFLPGREQTKVDSQVEPCQVPNTAAARLETNRASESIQPSLPNDLCSLMSSVLQRQMGQAAKPESLLPLLQNLALQKNQHGESCSTSRWVTYETMLKEILVLNALLCCCCFAFYLREEKVDPALEKLLFAHLQRMEQNLMSHIDRRMKCLQDHLDSRIDQLLHLMESSRYGQCPVSPGDKLVNGHVGHSNEQERDSDVLMGH
ncbi:ATPase PAAT [Gastrophryne carolinensis]